MWGLNPYYKAGLPKNAAIHCKIRKKMNLEYVEGSDELQRCYYVADMSVLSQYKNDFVVHCYDRPVKKIHILKNTCE